MKKHILFVLCAALLLSGCSYRLGGASGEAGKISPADSGEGVSLSPTPEPGLTAEETLNRIYVSYVNQKQDYKDDAGSAVVLNFRCVTPQTEIPGRTGASDSINRELVKLTDDFISGSKKEGRSSAEQFLNRANSAFKKSGGDGFEPCLMSRSAYVSRGDAALISFLYRDELSNASVQDLLSRGYTFDTGTGHRLAFTDLAADSAALKALCTDILRLSLPEADEETLRGAFEEGRWYFSANGLEFIFNPGDLTEAETEPLNCTVDYATLSGVLHERFMIPDAPILYGGMGGSRAAEQDLRGLSAQQQLVLDKPGEQYVLWADNSVYDLRLCAVEYSTETGLFTQKEELFFCSRLDDGEFISLQADLGEILPKYMLTWRFPDGTYERALLFASGEDGHLCFADPWTVGREQPGNITALVPFTWGLDNSGTLSTIVLVEPAELQEGENLYTLAVLTGDDTVQASARFIAKPQLWIADADEDGWYEFFLEGPCEDGDRVYAWRYKYGLWEIGFGGGENPDAFAAGRIDRAGLGELVLTLRGEDEEIRRIRYAGQSGGFVALEQEAEQE